MLFVIVNTKAKYLRKKGIWCDELEKANIYDSQESAGIAIKKLNEPVFIQQIAFVLWGSPIKYEP